MEITLDEAVEKTFSIARDLNTQDTVTGAMALERVFDFYKTRVEGAVLASDGDMLLLQWGSQKALLIDQPTDLRTGEHDLQFEDSRRLYLDFTRQLFVQHEDQNTEFDDVAVQISFTLYYDIESEKTQLGNMWIESPDNIDQRKSEFLEKEFVSSLINLPAEKIVVTACLCG